MKQLDQILTNIAKEHLDIPTLNTRMSDAHDFHHVPVWQVEAALKAAYKAGAKATCAVPRPTPDEGTQHTNCKSPWSLHFDRDGTENVAIIFDANGADLVRSRDFWLPEGDDAMTPILAAMRLMVTAPNLLDALNYLLAETVDMDIKYGIPLSEGEEDARVTALSVIAEATRRAA